ncbi:MAG TPA: DUF4424 domain-containing protein [Devosia sp.]|nr:DUF4424 domain-containing protein [Devosia sp.]
MRRIAAFAGLAAAMTASGALANDSMATLGAGGLTFVTTDKVEMASEDLFVSPRQVKVVYRYRNTADTDQHALIAFPMPDITGDGDFTVAIPTEDPENIFGFKTTFDGKPVDATLHQYAFAVGIDQTDYLKKLGVPLAPYGAATQDAINALSDADHQRMMQLGLVIPMTYDAGKGEQTDYTPVWTLKSAYSWEADFPAGKTVEVVHSYKPSVGGTVATTFLGPAEGEDRAADYRKKYCTDADFVRTVRKSLKNPQDPYSAPYTESWLSYVWSTGANWNGPIHDFHLTIDKGDPKSLVSFCWNGKVTKTGPTTFEMQATDFTPPYEHELEILLLNPAQGN